ncbi:uncharacterized protein LOC134205769 [Armigeres subalbatus]|uniref:uncharacterized protein LOC134205769 n=1 Tax=Armigeres subalbatus TaxID=124917 RepID=UPI002ED1616B
MGSLPGRAGQNIGQELGASKMASSSSPYSSQSAVRNGPGSSASARDANNFMNEDNLLKLALKKPKSWKWELTTSSSSPSISFPKIQLFDSRTGEMMVQVDKPDCVVKSEELVSKGSALDRSQSLQERKGHDQRYRRSRSTCIREKVTTSSEFLSDVFAQLQGKGMGHKLATSVTQYRVENEEDEEADGSGFGLQKSQSAKEIRRSWSLEQKKKVLKSPPNRSGSMLGKISESYKTSTEEEPPRAPTPPPSPEPTPTIPEISVVEEPEPKPTQEGDKNKIYKLVRSNVGTLIVREESFHTQRSLRRRRQLLQKQQALPESEPQQVDQRITIGDIPDSSYNDTIKEIDSLISKVMLSHTLQDVQEPSRPSPSRGRTSTVAALQNGGTEPVVRKRRSRRSASAGSNASSYGSRRSQRSSNSPLVTAPTGSSSSDEDSVSLAESRFGSLKRRGRAKYKRNSTGQVHEVYGGLVNGSGKQHESNVRRSNTGSSNNSTTVEIEECESLSLGSFRSSGSAKPQTIVQQSSEKSSSTSLSTLSSPSPAAEPTRNIRPNRWGTHEASTPARDPERVQQKTIEIESRFQKNDAQSNTDLSNTESLSKYHDSKSQFSSRNSESIIDSKVLVTHEAVTPSREPERVLQNTIEIKSRFKKDDAQSNSSFSVEACESLNKNDVSKSHYTSEKLESIVDSNVVMTEADLAQLKNDIIEHSTKTFVNNKRYGKAEVFNFFFTRSSCEN